MPVKGWKPSRETVARRAATIAAKQLTPMQRLLAKIEQDPNGGCWLWGGTILSNTGYGQLEIAGRSIGAHRLSYELHRGPIPSAMQVCHKCDVRACVNPAHLFLGTHDDNMRDMRLKGRATSRFGEDHTKAKITEADIPKILARLLIGHTCIAIAADYGVTDCAINAIRRGKSWNHVTGLPKVRVHHHDGAEDRAGGNPTRSAA